MSPEENTTVEVKKPTAGEAAVAVFKSTKYWNGVVRGAFMPPLKALVASSNPTWDDTLLATAESFLDTLLPLDK